MLLTSLLAVCAVAAVAAAPAPEPRRIKLSEADKRTTICPIVVETDIDQNRIPQRIKVIKCKEGGVPAAAAHGAARHRHHHGQCAALSKGNQLWACAELYDTVLVYYRNGDEANRISKMDVPVGCTCLEWQPDQARNTDTLTPP